MTFLELSNNLIVSIPPAISHLTRLKKLKLSKNKLEQVPNLKGLASLDLLALDSNKISSLSGLPAKLKTLSLQNNALQQFPAAIKALKSLEKLNLSKNSLTGKVPGKSQACKRSRLGASSLFVLLGWLGGLKYLKSLELDDNQLKSIEAGLGDADKLESLTLRRNNLSRIPAAVLKSRSLAA